MVGFTELSSEVLKSLLLLVAVPRLSGRRRCWMGPKEGQGCLLSRHKEVEMAEKGREGRRWVFASPSTEERAGEKSIDLKQETRNPLRQD